jgi:hypothetical protein
LQKGDTVKVTRWKRFVVWKINCSNYHLFE